MVYFYIFPKTHLNSLKICVLFQMQISDWFVCFQFIEKFQDVKEATRQAAAKATTNGTATQATPVTSANASPITARSGRGISAPGNASPNPGGIGQTLPDELIDPQGGTGIPGGPIPAPSLMGLNSDGTGTLLKSSLRNTSLNVQQQVIVSFLNLLN